MKNTLIKKTRNSYTLLLEDGRELRADISINMDGIDELGTPYDVQNVLTGVVADALTQISSESDVIFPTNVNEALSNISIATHDNTRGDSFLAAMQKRLFDNLLIDQEV